jgi:hypothetical protein
VQVLGRHCEGSCWCTSRAQSPSFRFSVIRYYFVVIISIFLIGHLAYWGTDAPQLIRIDGTAFRFMGPEGEAGGNLPQPIQQLSSTVRPSAR